MPQNHVLSMRGERAEEETEATGRSPGALCQTQKTVQASTTTNRLGHKTETAWITTFKPSAL